MLSISSKIVNSKFQILRSEQYGTEQYIVQFDDRYLDLVEKKVVYDKYETDLKVSYEFHVKSLCVPYDAQNIEIKFVTKYYNAVCEEYYEIDIKHKKVKLNPQKTTLTHNDEKSCTIS
jgi:hypothetical protein